VVGCARRRERVAEILSDADPKATRSLALACDVRDEQQVRDTFAAELSRPGERSVEERRSHRS
jgi:NAD(P)-dependent dehydrogenase (short-subunit alcohol dehydrogenase family)